MSYPSSVTDKANAATGLQAPVETPEADNGKENLDWKPSTREWLVILCLCIVSLVVALDFNILAPVLPVSLNEEKLLISQI